MTPTDYAADELSMWEAALSEQRQVEQELATAKSRRRSRRVSELKPQVEALRVRADMLLAHAVKMKWVFRERRRTIQDAEPGAGTGAETIR